MGKEIERKFLVDASLLKDLPQGKKITQGYMTIEDPCVRIRIKDIEAFITIKYMDPNNSHITRNEFEYSIPLNDAKELLKQCSYKVEKVRYNVEIDGLIWEIDQFEGFNKGLWIAEVELKKEKQKISIPNFCIKEVSDNIEYLNVNLAIVPFQNWHPAKFLNSQTS